MKEPRRKRFEDTKQEKREEQDAERIGISEEGQQKDELGEIMRGSTGGE